MISNRLVAMVQMRPTAPNRPAILTMEICVAGSLTTHLVGDELLLTLGLPSKVAQPPQERDPLLTTPKVLPKLVHLSYLYNDLRQFCLC